MDVQKLFAERIGGYQFGKVQQVFKFTLIDNAKREFIAKNPTVKVIDMGVGEPEELPAVNIIDRLNTEARVKENRIYPCNGILEFHESAARYMKRAHGIVLDAKTEVMHCVGTKTALVQIPFAFVNPGDTVIITDPGYPILPKACRWLGADVISERLYRENGFLPRLDEVERIASTKGLKLLLLNYPNNPTGAAAPLDFLKKTVELAHRYNFLIVQDAAYADFVFDGRFNSPLHVDGGREVTLELYSLSKSYNMQGYRLGFVVGGAPLVKAFANVKDNTDNGQFIAVQKAGIEALDNSEKFLAGNREKYKSRLERTVAILNAAGLEAKVPAGTFYLYIPVPKQFQGQDFDTAQSFADYLITKFGIISVPWEEAGANLRLSMTFEIGNKDFQTEDEVFVALEQRLVHGKL